MNFGTENEFRKGNFWSFQAVRRIKCNWWYKDNWLEVIYGQLLFFFLEMWHMKFHHCCGNPNSDMRHSLVCNQLKLYVDRYLPTYTQSSVQFHFQVRPVCF